MELKVVKLDPNVTHIALQGKLDLSGESEIGDEFRNLIDSHNAAFIVDMSGVGYLASLGIRLLFAGAKNLSGKGHKLIVLNPQPMVEETLMTSGTAKLIPIAHSLEEAKALL